MQQQTSAKVFGEARLELVLKDTIASMQKLLQTKGAEYQVSQADVLSNFRSAADQLGVPMELIWRIYAGKHWDSLTTYVRDIIQHSMRERSEPIEGRIDDLIVYLVLLRCMCLERKGADK